MNHQSIFNRLNWNESHRELFPRRTARLGLSEFLWTEKSAVLGLKMFRAWPVPKTTLWKYLETVYGLHDGVTPPPSHVISWKLCSVRLKPGRQIILSDKIRHNCSKWNLFRCSTSVIADLSKTRFTTPLIAFTNFAILLTIYRFLQNSDNLSCTLERHICSTSNKICHPTVQLLFIFSNSQFFLNRILIFNYLVETGEAVPVYFL